MAIFEEKGTGVGRNPFAEIGESGKKVGELQFANKLLGEIREMLREPLNTGEIKMLSRILEFIQKEGNGQN